MYIHLPCLRYSSKFILSVTNIRYNTHTFINYLFLHFTHLFLKQDRIMKKLEYFSTVM